MIVGPAFATVRDLVLQHGRASKPLPHGQWSRGLQAYYANALHAAMSGRWVYVEGFAIPSKGDLAVLHAWVTNPKKPTVAHDPTWGRGRELLRHYLPARLRTPHARESRTTGRSRPLGTRVAIASRRRSDCRRDRSEERRVGKECR